MGYHIEIPEPVIEAEVNWLDTTDDTFAVDVTVGGVVVMSPRLNRNYSPQTEWFSDSEEAERGALRLFGERFKEVFADGRGD